MIQNSYAAEEQDDDCPLCMEEMDPSDRNFRPCPCGYQVCRFCWHRLKEQEGGKCPACRRIYTEDAVQFTPVPPEELDRVKQKKKATKERRESQGGIIASRKHLSELRVIQKNLMYVIGISMKIAEENILMEPQYFGQYGKITKIVVNKKAYGSGPNASASAYITFTKNGDALRAIEDIDGSIFDGRVLRATYGTTKYCSFFLRGLGCTNPECLYLHEMGEEVSSYTKDQLNAGKHHLQSFVVDQNDSHSYKKFGTPPAPSTPQRAVSTPPGMSSSAGSSPICLDIPAPAVSSGTSLSSSPGIDSFFDRIRRWKQSEARLSTDDESFGKPLALPIEPPVLFNPFGSDDNSAHDAPSNKSQELFWTKELLLDTPQSQVPQRPASATQSSYLAEKAVSSTKAISEEATPRIVKYEAKKPVSEPPKKKEFSTLPKVVIKPRPAESPRHLQESNTTTTPSKDKLSTNLPILHEPVKVVSNRNAFNILETDDPSYSSSSEEDEPAIPENVKQTSNIKVVPAAKKPIQEKKIEEMLPEVEMIQVRDPLSNVLKMKKPSSPQDADKLIGNLDAKTQKGKDEVKLLEDQLRVSMASLIQSLKRQK